MTTDAPVTPVEAPGLQVDALTGLRGFAALAVVAVHASGRTDFDWFGIHGYGPAAKKRTHRMERRAGARQVRKESEAA